MSEKKVNAPQTFSGPFEGAQDQKPDALLRAIALARPTPPPPLPSSPQAGASSDGKAE